MLSREEMIERLVKADEDGVYKIYGEKNFSLLTDEEIENLYINQNIVFDYLFISSHKPV